MIRRLEKERPERTKQPLPAADPDHSVAAPCCFEVWESAKRGSQMSRPQGFINKKQGGERKERKWTINEKRWSKREEPSSPYQQEVLIGSVAAPRCFQRPGRDPLGLTGKTKQKAFVSMRPSNRLACRHYESGRDNVESQRENRPQVAHRNADQCLTLRSYARTSLPPLPC